MSGYVHDIDPVMFGALGLTAYWYGFMYTLGFGGMWAWLSFRRRALEWSRRQVADAMILFCSCILLLGRAFDVVVYEWDWYLWHLGDVLSIWKGGMASHGVLLGGVLAVFLAARLNHSSFLRLADEIAIPAAAFLAIARLGNFIEGGVIGTATGLPWGVQFPGVEGFRHPVALYDGAKNLLMIPILLFVRRGGASRPGLVMAHFLLWYGLLRLLIEFFRDYESQIWGVGPGQYFNALVGVIGLWLVCRLRRQEAPLAERRRESGRDQPARWRVIPLAALIFFPLCIPSSWTGANIEAHRLRSLALDLSVPVESAEQGI